eukprot:1950395-Rhodomonas_salina.1
MSRKKPRNRATKTKFGKNTIVTISYSSHTSLRVSLNLSPPPVLASHLVQGAVGYPGTASIRFAESGYPGYPGTRSGPGFEFWGILQLRV